MKSYVEQYRDKLTRVRAERKEAHAIKSLTGTPLTSTDTSAPTPKPNSRSPSANQLIKERIARWSIRLNAADRQRLYALEEIASLTEVPSRGLIDALHQIGWQPVQIRLGAREGREYCQRWRHPDFHEEHRPLTPTSLLEWLTANPTEDGHFDSEVVRKHFTGQSAGLTPSRKAICDTFEAIGFEYRRIQGGLRRWSHPDTPRIRGTRGRKPSVEPTRRKTISSPDARED